MISEIYELQRWGLVPPDQVFVLLAVYNNVVIWKVNDLCLGRIMIGSLTICHAFVGA